MKNSTHRCATGAMLLVAAFTCAALFAQQPSRPPSETVPVTTPAQPLPTKLASPSADTIKRAKAGGLNAEMHKGATLFCWQDSNTGSHIATKKCVDETRLEFILDERQRTRDQLKPGGTSRN
jgi:hypothetical protein